MRNDSSSVAGATGTRRAQERREKPLRTEWRQLAEYLRRRGPSGFLSDMVRAFQRNNLLTYASAISYQTVFALVPSLLAGIALLGFLDLQEVWRNDVAPVIRDRLTEPGFEIVDRTARRILESQQGLWLTLGAALALFEVSGAVRATMGAFNEIYGAREARGFVHRVALSFALAAVVAAGIVAALATFHFAPRLWTLTGADGLALEVLRWPVAVVLLLGVVAVLVRFGPSDRQPMPWASVVAVAIVLSWICASLLFAFYATRVASYGSLYGGLSVVIVLLTYVYLSVLVFLGGIQVDALLRREDAEDA